MKPWRVHKTGCPLFTGDELLLRAALLGKDEALAAWRGWKQRADLDALDVNASRLLPLLYANLRRHGVSDPLMARLQGVYRYNALRNQGFLRDLNGALRVLAEQGIPVMVLKGMALAVGCYGDLALRPMQDLDLLVKPQDAIRAMRALIAQGWALNTPPGESLGPEFVAKRIEYSLNNQFGTKIDLHWAAKQLQEPVPEVSYWEQTEELEGAGSGILALNATESLFYAFTHSIKHFGINAPRMLADMHCIIGRRYAEIDWACLEQRIRQTNLMLPARKVLRYLTDLLHSAIPASLLRRLDSTPIAGREWHTYYGLNRSPEKLGNILLLLMRMANEYLQQKEKIGRKGKKMSLAEYLKWRWGLREMGQVPSALLSKTWAHLRRELGSPAARRK
ncbi:MAG: nucleotidyltransferase family protein [Desulfarculaceae bacterium]|nr:nucleotidyltransferase family protein [Desulfarculaceae bacterium]